MIVLSFEKYIDVISNLRGDCINSKTLHWAPRPLIMKWGDLIDEGVYKDKDYVGEMLEWLIQNSPKNRKLNLDNDDVAAEKIAYVIGIVYFIRKYIVFVCYLS